MNKEEKAAAVAELSDRLREAEAIFAIDYRGISVSGAAELRTRLAEADAVFKVVKNRLAKMAVADAGAEALDELLVGPTALTLIKGDAVIAAKAMRMGKHVYCEKPGAHSVFEARVAARVAARVVSAVPAVRGLGHGISPRGGRRGRSGGCRAAGRAR
jgi:ribosomal protein L10